jgi:hypothetical protein
MLMNKRRYLIFTVVFCVFVVNAFTHPNVQATPTEPDHITDGEANAIFHAYMTGGFNIILHENEHALVHAVCVLDNAIFNRIVISPFPYYQYLCVEDAHIIQYAISFLSAETQQEAEALADIYTDEIFLVHPDGTWEALDVIRRPVRNVKNYLTGERMYRQNIGLVLSQGELPAGEYVLVWYHYINKVLHPMCPIYKGFTMLACNDYH